MNYKPRRLNWKRETVDGGRILLQLDPAAAIRTNRPAHTALYNRVR
jgi:hypothetical protein